MFASAVFALVFFWVLAELPGSARADSPVVSASNPQQALRDRKQRAKVHFERGEQLFAQKQWQQAHAEFESSRAIFPTAVAWVNSAICLKRLARYAEALAAYETAQRELGDQLDISQLDVVERAQAELHQLVAEIDLTLNVAGARVLVDEREYLLSPERGPVTLDPGRHLLRITKDGYSPITRALELSSGQHLRLELRLEPVPPPLIAADKPPTLSKEAPARRSRKYSEVEQGRFALEATTGLAFAPSLGGTAEASCGSSLALESGDPLPRCAERARPPGLFGSVRFAYQLLPSFSLDAALGYFALRRGMVRRLSAKAQDVEMMSRDLRDELEVKAPFVGVGASYSWFVDTPLLVRLTAGVARARVTASDHGHFSAPKAPDADQPMLGSFDLVEEPRMLLIPFIAPEVRAGVRVGARLVVSLGLAGWVAFPPARRRTSDMWSSDSVRRAALQVDSASQAHSVQLPSEDALGTWFMFIPSFGLTYSL